MNTQPLSGKKIAILGGMGSRGESRDALIEELDLAELDWVYSERNKVKEYANFCESVYPGKYESHKVWEQIKKYDLASIKLVRVNGSYNAEGFIRAVLEQYPVKEEARSETTLEALVFKRLLAPAEADNTEVKFVTQPTPPKIPSEIPVGRPTQEEIRLAQKVVALEAEVTRLRQAQQDDGLLKSAVSFYDGFASFVGGYPIPVYLKKAADEFLQNLKERDVDVKRHGGLIAARPKDEMVMMTNIVVSEMFSILRLTLQYTCEKKPTDRHGACLACGRHKSIGCRENCSYIRMREIYTHICKGLDIAKSPSLKDVLGFLKNRVLEFR
jgi:hypothetical protein